MKEFDCFSTLTGTVPSSLPLSLSSSQSMISQCPHEYNVEIFISLLVKWVGVISADAVLGDVAVLIGLYRYGKNLDLEPQHHNPPKRRLRAL